MPRLGDHDRARLLAEVRGLAGAALQKLWLPSAQVCVLQLRAPDHTRLAVVDARQALAALAPARPTAPDSAPKSQATLRRALAGARLLSARLELAADAPSRRPPSVRLSFETPEGPRALVAEHEGGLLLLGAGERIVWASAGAGPARRAGSTYPGAQEVALPDAPPLPDRDARVREALRAEEEAGVAARRQQLVARLRARAQKLARTLEAVGADAARAAGAESGRRDAGLLLPHQGAIPRGAREASVPDWSQLDEAGEPARVTLQLDPALSAAENAARWLKRARRYAAAAARIAARREEVEAELARARALLSRAGEASSAAELVALEAEAGPERQRARLSARGVPRLPYRTFRSRAGLPVLVGRGARDNDALTLRIARGNDLWLHARGVQGAHVVIPGAGEVPDPRALADAALLAVHFSSARGADGAEVSFTRCKYVRKAKGAAPGAVTYSQEKTLRVRADESRLAALLAAEEHKPA